MSLQFTCTKAELPDYVRRFSAYLDADRKYTVILKRYSKPRSVGFRSQNHHIHGHATQIAEYVGDSKREIIYLAMEDAVSKGYPTRLNHRNQVVPVPEEEIDSRAANLLIEQLHEIADKLEIDLIEYPDPGSPSD
tara:strand:- start:2153 stop:2557 length:405 start_codon:yes stop_codon:yes gene_type:complete